MRLILLLAVSSLFSWAPEPNPSAFTLPANQWTKVAEAPEDLFGRELEPGQGSYLCFFPDSGLFFRYGGYTPNETNDLWTFDLAARKWVNKAAVDYAWPPPQNRPGAGPWWSMAYDSKRKVIWMMCGSGSTSPYYPALYDDLWKYDPATGAFTKMNSQNFYHGAEVRIVYDSINDRVLRAPAYDREWGYIDNQDKTWSYNPNTNAWEGRSTPGSPKYALAAVWVYAKDFGKAVYLSKDTLTDSLNRLKAVTWTYDYASNTWTRLNPAQTPLMRVAAAACYDPVHKLVIIHGGVGGYKDNEQSFAYRGGGPVLEDTWALDLSMGQWTLLSVGAPSIPALKAGDGSPLLPQKPSARGRLVFTQAADYDVNNNAFVVSSPYYGVWALRYQPGLPLPALNLPALPALPGVSAPSQVFPPHPLNQKLLSMGENQWVQLGGSSIGGGEIPLKFDPASGYLVKYGGCNNGGTTFASGYGNDLVAYDPSVERWFAIRCVDPCGPARPANGCTRYFAADAAHECVWFAGGTSGNFLASAIPFDWTGGNGTWKYVWKSDRFEYVASTGTHPGGSAGVVCAFDNARGLLMAVPKAYSPNVSVYNAATSSWVTATTTIYAAAYTYADFIDSLGVMGVMDGSAFRTLNPATGAWGTLPSPPSVPSSRPTLAYDPYNNIVLMPGPSGTYAYDVRQGSWHNMNPSVAAPDFSGFLAFDRRHGVFIGTVQGSTTWAYKYRNVPGLKAAARPCPENPQALTLSPNPFADVVAVSHESAGARIMIYDTRGRLVAALANAARWDGKDAMGRIVPSGIYLVCLETGNQRISRVLYKVK